MTFDISPRTRAFLAGVFILVAYGVLASAVTQSRIIVMIADVVSGLAVIGIAVLMFPLFKAFQFPSKWYLFLKLVEGSSMIAGGIVFIFPSLQPVRDVIYNDFHIYIFILSTFFFYWLLFQTQIVPRFIAVWGAVGIVALLVSTLLKLTPIHFAAVDYLLVLIVTNEIFLAGWLMSKGYVQPK